MLILAVDYLPRTGKSKIVPWDAHNFAVLILRTAMLFKPLRVFLPLVVLCLLYGSVKMGIDNGPRSEHLRFGAVGLYERATDSVDRNAWRRDVGAIGPVESEYGDRHPNTATAGGPRCFG
jgi:hypothetical protein